jgi:Fibronectin type III domain
MRFVFFALLAAATVSADDKHGGHKAPAAVLTLVSGNKQAMPSATFLPDPLVVKVTDASGAPLVFELVTFSNEGANGGLATKMGGELLPYIHLVTDENGLAAIYFAVGTKDGDKSTVTAKAVGSTIQFEESSEEVYGTVAAPSDIKATPGMGNGEIDLTWVNNATNATYILVFKSADHKTWIQVTKINDPTATSYTVKDLDPGVQYFFAVVAGYPDPVKPAKAEPAKDGTK